MVRDGVRNGSERGDDPAEDDHRSDPTDTFAALSDPTRIDILRTLSEHHRGSNRLGLGEADPIGFAALRKRVGVRDSGRFRYHLNRLRDRFVEKVDGGYQLTHAGFRIVGAILAGTYTETVSMGPAELDSTCPICGQPALASVEDGLCVVTCPDEHLLFQWNVPPNFAADAELAEVIDVAELLALQAVEQLLTGMCPHCSDPIDPDVVTDAAHGPQLRAVCDRCGVPIAGPLGHYLLVDPDIAAFYRRHGLTPREHHVWEFPSEGDGLAVTAVGEDPRRLEVTVELDDETLSATLDGSGRVLAVDPPYRP